MNNLLLLRKNRKLKQADLAKELGIAISTYSYWENNINEPDVSSLKKLADFFDVSVDVLLDRAEITTTQISESVTTHKQKWLSTLTPLQQTVVTTVLSLDELQLGKVLAYMHGLTGL